MRVLTPYWGLVEDQFGTYTIIKGRETPLRGVSEALAHDYIGYRYEPGQKVTRISRHWELRDITREFAPPPPRLSWLPWRRPAAA